MLTVKLVYYRLEKVVTLSEVFLIYAILGIAIRYIILSPTCTSPFDGSSIMRMRREEEVTTQAKVQPTL